MAHFALSFRRFSFLAALLALMALFAGCESTGGEAGTPCLSSIECDGDLICFQKQNGTNACMAPCAEDVRLCDGGEVCLAGTGGVRVCYTGGEGAQDAPCSAGQDCAAGLVCIDPDGDGAQAAACEEACDPRTPRCRDGHSCFELNPTAGYCAADEQE